MNFSDKNYQSGLKNILNGQLKSNHSIGDCFYQLISDVPMEVFNNLILLMMKNSSLLGYDILDKKTCYQILINKNTDEKIKLTILNMAYFLLDNNLPLGDSINEFGFNKSSWISHSLEEARLCAFLAKKLNLDEKFAFKRGLMHDYGRKYIQKFSHVIVGFEKMFDCGYYEEAIGCLTHSFLNGNIYACYNESKSYAVDNNMQIRILDESFIVSDLFVFLNNYVFTDYDRILNMADLMATEFKIVSPEQRILNIEKRRRLDDIHREYFILELKKMIMWFLNQLDIADKTGDFHSLSDSLYKFITEEKDKDKVKKYSNYSLL